MTNDQGAGGRQGSSGVPREIAAGALLLVIAAITLFGISHLPAFLPQGLGAGLLPKATGVMVGLFGAYLIAHGISKGGDFLDRWAVREIFFVLGAVLLFAWTIRPLGLIVAGPLAVFMASQADKEAKLFETLLFAVLITAFCIGLFSLALRLPIPVMPTGLPVPFDALLKK